MVSISPLVHYLPHTLDGILSKLSVIFKRQLDLVP